MIIHCVGGPKDGQDLETQGPTGDMLPLIKESGLHPGHTPSGEEFQGWYNWDEEKQALIWEPDEDE